MKPNRENTAKRIGFLRENLNLSISQFGEKLDNTPKSTVNSWLRGLSLPSDKKLSLIAKISNTTSEWILWGDMREFIKIVLTENYGERFEKDSNIVNDIYKSLRQNGFSEHEKYPTNFDVLSLFNQINSEFYNHETVIKKVNNTILVYKNSRIIFDYTFSKNDDSNEESELLFKEMIKMFNELEIKIIK